MQSLNLFMLGAIAFSLMIAGVFFLRFWVKTRDRLFLLFGLSFFIEGINRTALALSDNPREGEPFFYIIRLLSFCLILFAILEKNFGKSSRQA